MDRDRHDDSRQRWILDNTTQGERLPRHRQSVKVRRSCLCLPRRERENRRENVREIGLVSSSAIRVAPASFGRDPWNSLKRSSWLSLLFRYNDATSFASSHCESQTMKRKRKAHAASANEPSKKHKVEANGVSHPVLEKYYRRVATLRDHLLSALPAASKHRRLLLHHRALSTKTSEADKDILARSYDILDNVLVCNIEADDSSRTAVQPLDHLRFSQQVAASSGESIAKSQVSSQTDVRFRFNASHAHLCSSFLVFSSLCLCCFPPMTPGS